MSVPDGDRNDEYSADNGESYPLKDTAAMLNERLGLYLSPEQQRGFAAGLLIGTALGAAVLAWNLTAMARRSG